MGGSNPYIPAPEIKPPTRPYQITIKNTGKVINVDPSQKGSGTGLPQSVLDVALAAGVDIDHACGGVCACSTCHIYVLEGEKTCSTAQESELDMLDLAPDLKRNSRLACQCVPNGESDLVIEIPSWNRNAVREGK